MNDQTVLVINAGSSTIKVGIFAIEWTGIAPRYSGLIEKQAAAPRLELRDPDGVAVFNGQGRDPSGEDVIDELITWLDGRSDIGRVAAVGHRVVHGGPDFTEPIVATTEIVRRLADLAPLAPLHQQHCLEPIRFIASRRPELPQIACFDTNFHRTIDATARRLPLPRRFEADGVQKYGFHGLSYEYIASRLPRISPKLAEGRVVVAHLGSGASLCAMRGGVSVDTTMGLTPLDGLMMATRCGSIDPGALLYLLGTERMSADELQRMLYEKSGLLGVSGVSGDMRKLLKSANPEASLAVDMFCRRVAAGIALMVHSLRGLDGIVFTGGIGENSGVIRQRVCAELSWLGVNVNQDVPDDGLVSPKDAIVEVRVMRTSEETMIARHVSVALGRM